MTVAFDTRMRGFAGIGRFIDDLGGALSRTDLPVVALTDDGASTDRPGAVAPRLRAAAVRGHALGPVAQVDEARVLARLDVDVVHSPHLLVPFLSRVPTVLTVHDLFPLTDPGMARSRAAATYYRVVFPLAIKRANRLVAISDFTADSVATRMGARREDIVVIRHAVDRASWYPPTPVEVEAVRSVHRLPPDFLLYVASAKSHKNLATLLAAHTTGHLPLVVTGCRVEEALSAAGGAVGRNVHLLGRVDDRDLRPLFGAARAHVLPSLYEAVGLTVLEAWACGTAVICSRGGGLPETTGDAALTADALDVTAWSAAMHSVEDAALADELAAAGRERLGSRTWDDVAAEYAQVYAAVG